MSDETEIPIEFTKDESTWWQQDHRVTMELTGQEFAMLWGTMNVGAETLSSMPNDRDVEAVMAIAAYNVISQILDEVDAAEMLETTGVSVIEIDPNDPDGEPAADVGLSIEPAGGFEPIPCPICGDEMMLVNVDGSAHTCDPGGEDDE